MHHIVFSYHEFRELCVFREETGDWCEMTISAIENVAADFMIPGHRVIWDQGSRGPAPPGHHYQLSTIQCQTQLKLFSHFNWRRRFWIINKTNFYSSCFFVYVLAINPYLVGAKLSQFSLLLTQHFSRIWTISVWTTLTVSSFHHMVQINVHSKIILFIFFSFQVRIGTFSISTPLYGTGK